MSQMIRHNSPLDYRPILAKHDGKSLGLDMNRIQDHAVKVEEYCLVMHEFVHEFSRMFKISDSIRCQFSSILTFFQRTLAAPTKVGLGL